MNKIIVKQERIELNNEEVLIDGILNDLVIDVRGMVSCLIGSLGKKCRLEVNLEENSELNLEFFGEMEDTKFEVVINNRFNSKLRFNYACKYRGENVLNIYSRVKRAKSVNEIKVRAVDDGGSLEVLALGEIESNLTDIYYQEDIRVITKDNEKVKIKPDLIVKTNDVVASHNAVISGVSEKELFYLSGKGISLEKADSLIKEGFLNGILKIKQ